MTISNLTAVIDIPASVRTRFADAFATRHRRRAGLWSGGINEHLLRDIGVTPLGLREAALAARNETCR